MLLRKSKHFLYKNNQQSNNFMRSVTTLLLTIAFIITGILMPVSSLQAQEIPDDNFEDTDEITITLEEALQIAMINNYMLQRGLLDVELSEAQIREAWGSVYPQLNASGSYTRNILTPNPFAGSDAGGLFETLGAIDWLAFNENARTDGDPETSPISFDQYLERQQQGFIDAGLTPPGFDDSNPFGVDNQFEFGLSLTQAIYNGAAFAAIRGAQQLRDLNEKQVEVDRQNVAEEIKNSFYSALLAKEQVDVLQASADRLERTVEETRKSEEAGILSKYDRISAEVELVNLETNLLEAENQSELAKKNLALQLGIPPSITLNLRGELVYEESLGEGIYDIDHAYELALQQRPDLNQTESLLELIDVEGSIARSGYFPTVNAFANAAYIGQVPSNRTSAVPVEGEEFEFRSQTRSFFDDSYWNPSVAVGIRLNWNIFNGFQTRMNVQQNQIERKQAELDREFQKNGIYLELDQALKNLENALKRIQSQERNLEQAQLNYDFSLTRLREGAGTPLQERQASSLLDQSKLNYLSAVYDYLIAVTEYEKAIGKPLFPTSND